MEKVAKIYKGQKWAELYGQFTVGELEQLLEELKEANKNVPK